MERSQLQYYGCIDFTPRPAAGGWMKILVVDDHTLIREALRSVLTELKSDATILEASCCAEATRLFEQHPDLGLILLDLTLPDRDGFSMLGELRKRYDATAIVVLSASHDQQQIKLALALGADGFIPKTTERDVMVRALELVLSGGTYVPKEVLGFDVPAPPGVDRMPMGGESSLVDLGLTARQIEVLGLMMQGKSNKVIAGALGMAEPTVKNHITAVLKALRVTNRTEAVLKVGRMGWRIPQGCR
jgi:DNA-binding NarL/FixJ family response regulator